VSRLGLHVKEFGSNHCSWRGMGTDVLHSPHLTDSTLLLPLLCTSSVD
jgi:hypothetical protein